jgi:hypothetical protein
MKRLLAILLLAAGAVWAQEAAGTVTNSFALFQATLGARNVTLIVTIAVTYPDDLGDDQFIDFVTVSSDVQGFLSGYPNRQAPLEAFAAYATRELMKKYPQMTGASVVLSNNNLGIQVETARVAAKVAAPDRGEILERLRRARPAAVPRAQ